MSTRDPPRLGRGLAALLGDAAAPTEAPQSQTLSVDLLEPGPFQPRRSVAPQPLEELEASIRAQGVLQPLLVRPHPEKAGRYQIIAGERRWRASQRANLHELPVLIRQLGDSAAMAAALVENLQRQDLDSIEEAEGYRRLQAEFGLTQEQLGQAVGKSRSHIANALRLLTLPEPVLAELRAGRLSAGHARALLAHHDPAQAAAQVIARGLNVRQTEALASGERRAEPTTGTRDPEIDGLARQITDQIGLAVEISTNGKAGTVRIRFGSLDQLDSLVTLLLGGATA